MPSQSLIKCDYCEEPCQTEEERAHHLAYVHHSWTCVESLCGELIEGYDNLRKHVEKNHPKVGPISCPMCTSYNQKADEKENKNEGTKEEQEEKSKHFINWCRHASQTHLDPTSANNRRPTRRRKTSSGQRDDGKSLTELPAPVDENGNELNEDDDGKSSDNDVPGSFTCRACFYKLDCEDELLLHLQNTHEAPMPHGKTECKECSKKYLIDKIAKHGLQEHIQKFVVHCHFCQVQMTYITLIMHALTCAERPPKLDNATLLHALADGRVPECPSVLEGTSDAAGSTKSVESVGPSKDPNNNIVPVKTTGPN